MAHLAEQLGQMLAVGWSADESGAATQINDHAHALIEELRAGTVVLFSRNGDGLTRDQVLELTESLQKLARSAGLPPLFICTDQEGGRVARFGPPHFRKYPSAKSIGDSGDQAAAFDIAQTIGREMREIGVNWVLAPVLDVNNNPNNPVIGDRSFGNKPFLVSSMGAAAVRGFQDGAHILACGKHFPGHGDTDIDSHHALPRVPHSREHLDSVELAPFRATIDAGIGSIMTSHILFPALDNELPSSLSPRVLTRLLRHELGFRGLIVTDDLDMNGVAAKWGAPEAAVLAAIAGADILMCCHELSTQRKVQKALLDAAESGRLTAQRITESVERVRTAKALWVE